MKWALLLLLCLCGCRTEYVPVESVRYDSLFFSQLIRDSVYVRDSVYIRDRGDTVYLYKDKYVFVYKDRVDTLFVEREKKVEIPVPVERKLSWWERVKIDYGGWVMLIVFIAFLWRLKTWFARRIRKE